MTHPRPPALLDHPAAVAAARIARDRIETATRELERLADPEDAEALHDFRVSVRRLRSTLRAYRPWLGRAASRKVRSALRDLGRATNAGRDAEVQAQWLASSDRRLSERERVAAAKLAERLRKRPSIRVGDLQVALYETMDKILKRLDFSEEKGPAFRVVYAPLLAEHAAAAAARLAAISSSEQFEEAHEARIAVKRLRYLLEPLAMEVRDAPALLDHIKVLQDLLGELHDSHVLDETLADAQAARRSSKATLAALAAQNADRRAAIFTQLRRRWLGAAPTSFFEQIRRLVASG
jgi:CHAD domain-containing protein